MGQTQLTEKNEMTSLDMKFVVDEIRKKAAGGTIKKIYQYGSKGNHQFLFEIYKKGMTSAKRDESDCVTFQQGLMSNQASENFWLYFDSRKIFLTEYKKTSPITPPSFCMFLRKYLMGAKIQDISQYNFDRVVEIKTENNTLIVELFGGGNVILTDTNRSIIMPLEIQKWKDREIRPRVPYKYPSSNLNPFGMSLDSLRKIISQEKTISSILDADFGFGKEYAFEICHTAKIDPHSLGKKLSVEEISGLHKIFESFARVKIKPTQYTDFVSIFPMSTFVNRKPVKESITTVSAAFDEYFSKKEIKSMGEEAKKFGEEKQKKMEHILKTQKVAEEKFKKEAVTTKNLADVIYKNYTLIDSILGTIRKLLRSGKKWPEIKQAIEKEDTPETNAIKEIREHEGVIVLSILGEKIELDINKSIEQNAADYYEGSKKFKRKLENVRVAMENVNALEKKLESKKPEEELVQMKERKKWYEKFKWFISSSGFLVVAGRDATQNENIVKKHANKDDFLLHADITGAAFTLVKYDKIPIDGITMKEAAEFAAANSKAWTKGIGNVDVYAFRPEQATKPEGSLGKGSFVIHGPRIWFKDMSLKISVGIKMDREKNLAKVISGPVMAVRKHADYFVSIHPGHKDSMELSREIKNKIILKCRPEDRYFIDRIQVSDIQVHIPSGRGEIVE